MNAYGGNPKTSLVDQNKTWYEPIILSKWHPNPSEKTTFLNQTTKIKLSQPTQYQSFLRIKFSITSKMNVNQQRLKYQNFWRNQHQSNQLFDNASEEMRMLSRKLGRNWKYEYQDSTAQPQVQLQKKTITRDSFQTKSRNWVERSTACSIGSQLCLVVLITLGYATISWKVSWIRSNDSCSSDRRKWNKKHFSVYFLRTFVVLCHFLFEKKLSLLFSEGAYGS